MYAINGVMYYSINIHPSLGPPVPVHMPQMVLVGRRLVSIFTLAREAGE
jgi:hypothetical protein